MSHLVPIQLEDGSEIYIEATDSVQVQPAELPAEQLRGGQKGMFGSATRGVLGYPTQSHSESPTDSRAVDGRAVDGRAISAQSFQALESTIRTYTNQTLNAFKELATANVDKVTLQFGIRVGGEAGVPYVTKGTAESNLNITVECSFKD
ncbi:MAG: hypothetical protein F6J97_21000 [Leptolyngbya sp. SIO4C1]|nr:hypothetical protein [Leptolyngbya sp. SIO4C1]